MSGKIVELNGTKEDEAVDFSMPTPAAAPVIPGFIREMMLDTVDRRWYQVKGSAFHKRQAISEFVLVENGIVTFHAWQKDGPDGPVEMPPRGINVVSLDVSPFQLAYMNAVPLPGKLVPRPVTDLQAERLKKVVPDIKF